MAWPETFPESLTELSREALIERVLELEAQLAEAQAQLAELRRQLFGSKAEKLSPEQQAQMDALASDLQQEAQKAPPLSEEVLEEERRDQRKRLAERRPVRHPVPPVLETETVTLEPAAEEKLCPHCGSEKQRIGEEVTDEIDRQQMVQWVEHIAGWLKPMYDAMWKEMKTTGYVQIDETPVKVLDPEVKGKAAQGYSWFYAVPRGDVILEFSRSRGQQAPRQRLEGFAGTIQTDAYEVYQALERKDVALQRIGCLAHSRRWFYQALKESLPETVWFIRQIRQLYRLEDQLRALDSAARYRLRQEQAPLIWEAMKQHAKALQPKLLPKSTLGKAVNYFLNEYHALVGYLADGRFEIDNNAAYAVRGINEGMPTSRLCRVISPPMRSERASAVLTVVEAA